MATILLNPGELDVRLRGLLGEERSVQVAFLLHLSRFEELRGHEVLGYARLWDYLRRELSLLEATAWRRLQAMTLLRKFPHAEPRLRDGRLSITSFVMLRNVINEENSVEYFDLIVGKSTREIETIAASLNNPVQPPKRLGVVRKLPQRRETVDPNPPIVAPPMPTTETLPIVENPAAASVGDVLTTSGTGSDPVEVRPFAFPSRAVGRARREVVLPVSADQFSIKLFVPAEFVAKLAAATRILSHKVPGGEVEKILSEALDRVLRDDARRYRTRGLPRVPKREPGGNDSKVQGGGEHGNRSIGPGDSPADFDRGTLGRVAIPAALERLVRERDGHRCCWRLANGEACGSVQRLEIDHVLAVALGGTTALTNLRLVCRDHNQMHARVTSGASSWRGSRGERWPGSRGCGRTGRGRASAGLDNLDSGGYLGAAAGDPVRPNSFRIPNR